MSDNDMRTEFRLEGEISEAVYSYFVDDIGYRGIHCDGSKYELEEADEDGSDDDTLVLVHESDGQRYEVELDFFVRKLPPKAPPPDPDAPVHIEGQEELPLGLAPAVTS